MPVCVGPGMAEGRPGRAGRVRTGPTPPVEGVFCGLRVAAWCAGGRYRHTPALDSKSSRPDILPPRSGPREHWWYGDPVQSTRSNLGIGPAGKPRTGGKHLRRTGRGGGSSGVGPGERGPSPRARVPRLGGRSPQPGKTPHTGSCERGDPGPSLPANPLLHAFDLADVVCEVAAQVRGPHYCAA